MGRPHSSLLVISLRFSVSWAAGGFQNSNARDQVRKPPPPPIPVVTRSPRRPGTRHPPRRPNDSAFGLSSTQICNPRASSSSIPISSHSVDSRRLMADESDRQLPGVTARLPPIGPDALLSVTMVYGGILIVDGRVHLFHASKTPPNRSV